MEFPNAVTAIEFGEIVIGGQGVVEAHEVIKPVDGETLAAFATRLSEQYPASSLRLKIKRGRPEYAIRQVV